MSTAQSNTFSVEVAAATEGVPAWVARLPLWHWHEIPNTALSSVEPSPKPYGDPSSKITAWCGAALKRRGSIYLIAMAGGHGDYAGNEVNALKLNAETPAWTQLRGPTPADQWLTQSQFYLDKRPAATHTYYAQQFINAQDRLMTFPYQGMDSLHLPAAPAGWPYARTSRYIASFDRAANDWDAPEHVAPYPGTGDWTACLVAKHPVTEDVYLDCYSGGLWKWTQATNAWTRITARNPAANYAGAAIDPERGRMLIVGDYSGTQAPRVVDLATADTVDASFGGLGSAALMLNGYPGVVYDESNRNFLVFHNGADQLMHVRRVDPATWHVDAPVITGGPLPRRVNGVLTAVQYVPELKGVVIANSYRGNVRFMRTAA